MKKIIYVIKYRRHVGYWVQLGRFFHSAKSAHKFIKEEKKANGVSHRSKSLSVYRPIAWKIVRRGINEKDGR